MTHIQTGKCYRNIKKKTVYQVVVLGVHSEDQQKMVAYVEAGNWRQRSALWLINLGVKMLEDSGNPALFWFRPLLLFKEKFEECE